VATPSGKGYFVTNEEGDVRGFGDAVTMIHGGPPIKK